MFMQIPGRLQSWKINALKVTGLLEASCLVICKSLTANSQIFLSTCVLFTPNAKLFYCAVMKPQHFDYFNSAASFLKDT